MFPSSIPISPHASGGGWKEKLKINPANHTPLIYALVSGGVSRMWVGPRKWRISERMTKVVNLVRDRYEYWNEREIVNFRK